MNIEKINPVDLLKFQVYDGEFIRWDTIIRVITAEHFIKTNEIHPLYKKDCYTRHLYIHRNWEGYNPQFCNIEKHIKSFMKSGEYLKKYPIEVYEDMLIHDGTHRLGISIAMNFKELWIKTLSGDCHSSHDATLQYYKERFRAEEVKLMIDKYNEIMGGE